MKSEQPLFDDVAMNESYLKKDVISDKSVKNVQFAKPYFQFSAACAGCAETTYIKLLSQLFGDRMYVGNAAGCSSAISGGAPILPYCRDCKGHGPAWEHSLFEDNAEFAFGFYHAQDAIRKELLIRIEALKNAGVAAEEAAAYLADWNDREKSREVSDALIAALEKAEQTDEVKYVLDNREFLAKKSVWAVGGDGWAYDIGFGGIDHVMAQNQDVNLLVLDTGSTPTPAASPPRRPRLPLPQSSRHPVKRLGKEGSRRDPDAVMVRLRCTGRDGADQAQTRRCAARGRVLTARPSSSATARALSSISRPAWQFLVGRDEEGGRVRLLAPCRLPRPAPSRRARTAFQLDSRSRTPTRSWTS